MSSTLWLLSGLVLGIIIGNILYKVFLEKKVNEWIDRRWKE